MKRVLNISDVFSSWEVIKCTDSKKYKYLCRCQGCGKEREFVKYHLLNGSYSICKTCAPATIKNISKIKYHWNTELNGTPFTRPQDFDLNRPYWFICNSLHNFRCSIKNFSLSHCASCKGKQTHSSNKLKIYGVAVKVLGAMMDIEEQEDFWIVNRDLNFAIHIVEGDRFSNFRKYFSSEKEMFSCLEYTRSIIEKYESEGLTTKEFFLQNNFEKDVDKFKEQVLYLSQ